MKNGTLQWSQPKTSLGQILNFQKLEFVSYMGIPNFEEITVIWKKFKKTKK